MSVPRPKHLPSTLDWDSLSEPEKRWWAMPNAPIEAELMKRGVRNARESGSFKGRVGATGKGRGVE